MEDFSWFEREFGGNVGRFGHMCDPHFGFRAKSVVPEIARILRGPFHERISPALESFYLLLLKALKGRKHRRRR